MQEWVGFVCLGFFLFNTNSFCMSTVYQVLFCYFSNTTIMPKMLMLGVCLWNFFFNLLKLQLLHDAAPFSSLSYASTVSVSLCQIWSLPSHLVKVIYKISVGA